ncbi:prokaryotic type I DNA topoisomerase [Syncephalis fuscata]|nr:prokaryotic type I DNA topoisomerase [Syncephalis fuscata]
MHILHVAEKPTMARSIAQILSQGEMRMEQSCAKYNKNFHFTYRIGTQVCSMVMTSVLGHLTEDDFSSEYRQWSNWPPSILFEVPIQRTISKNMKDVHKNLLDKARRAQQLYLWTDCDREGENIAYEIAQACLQANPRLILRRPRFSVVNARDINRACQSPTELDMRLVNAVDTRREIDLRLGAIFTRFQTMRLQRRFPLLGKRVISYGGCQFPTLGFVVDRFLKVENFVPQTFWKIEVRLEREDAQVSFLWRRVHLFDRLSCMVLYEACVEEPTATVLSVRSRATSKWKPLPLTTVELQKNASRFLNMSSSQAMTAAESLYIRGLISYPRTETNKFDPSFPFTTMIERQVNDPSWGSYAQRLINGGFKAPRQGKDDDRAHPPIHPTGNAADLTQHEKSVFEFVTRRFLACCSEDARGRETRVEVDITGEVFWTKGLIVDAKNYLDVYPYEKWNTRLIPNFEQGETFMPNEIMMTEGRTSAPALLREADLIAMMDANGIGTDATIHEHIKKVIDREYVFKQNGFFYPSTLGIGLVRGYDRIDLEHSLTKPLLRRQMEQDLKLICDGNRNRDQVIQATLRNYKQLFERTNSSVGILEEVSTSIVVALIILYNN